MKRWWALAVALPERLEDDILLALCEAGTLGVEVVEESPDAAGGRRVVGYFDPRADLGPLRESLRALDPALRPEAREVGEEPWVERQQTSRKPIEVGGRFLIVPASEMEAAPSAAPSGGPGTSVANGPPSSIRRDTAEGVPAPVGTRVRLIVPPGRAFGTGEHETTRLCLEALEEIPVGGARVLDIGTGSGILAMAASRLGAAAVVAVDNDPEACEIAVENLALNGFEPPASRPEVVAGTLESVGGPFDVALANLFPAALEAAAASLAARLDPGGIAVLSGFSPAEAEGLSHCYAGQGLAESYRREKGEWAVLVLRKTGGARRCAGDA